MLMGTVKYLKIREFAKAIGVSEQCVRNWDDDGILKCHHKSERGGYRYYTQEQVDEYLEKSKRRVKVIGYCRASEELKDDILRQESVLRNYVSTRAIDLKDFVIVKDVCNSINADGEGLKGVLKDISEGLVKELIVEDITRLSLLNTDIIELMAKANRCKITVLNHRSVIGQEDILSDCSKLLRMIKEKTGITKKDLRLVIQNM